MKIGVISDIHGNITALNAVLDDIKRRNINKIFCLGDSIVKCVHPDLVIDKLERQIRKNKYYFLRTYDKLELKKRRRKNGRHNNNSNCNSNGGSFNVCISTNDSVRPW